MKRLFTLLCSCTLFFFANAQCPLNNGGFENGLSGWNVTGDVQISTDARTGSSAAEICSAQTGINQVFQTQPGKNYDVSFWYSTASDHSLSVYQIRALDANWTPLEIPGSNGIIYATAGGLIAQTNGSYLSSIEFKMTTPPDAVWFQVSIWNEQGGCILIDDFKVCDSGTPPNGCANDTESPQISGCPDTRTVNATSSAGSQVVWTRPVITDNCDTPTITTTHTSGSFFPVGTTSVTISASDDSNNLSSCTFNITVNPFNPPNSCVNDTEPPVFTRCPSDQTATTTGTTAFVNWGGAAASDNCGPPTFSGNNDQGIGNYPVGVNEIIIIATDDAGNTATCSFNITVTRITPPSNSGNLVLETSDVNIDQWSTGMVEFVLRNIGGTSIDDIRVSFNLEDNIRLQGGNEYNASPNTTVTNAWSNLPIWNAGTLAAGEEKYIRFNVFAITSDPMYIYGQVSSATGNDANSTPGNGTPPTPTEDDEAVANINGNAPPGCSITATLASISACNDSGTPNDPNDDTFDAFLNVSGIGTGIGWSTRVNNVSNNYGYGNNIRLRNIEIIRGTNTYVLTDSDFVNNNCSTSITIVPPSPCSGGSGMADFYFESLNFIQPPTTAFQPFSYEYELGNAAAAVSGFVNIRVNTFISSDPIPSSDDIAAGENIINGLASGEVKRETGSTTLPSLAFGTYYLILVVDNANILPEENENNNTIAIPFTIGNTGNQADLTISNLVLDNLTVKTGDVLNYNFDISNIGTANVPQNFVVLAYLSTDGDISNDDIQDGIVPTGNFDAGLLVQGVPGASTINLPEGDYYLILRVDADNQVSESDETNNDLQASIQFTVDNSSGGGGSNCDVEVGNDIASFNCIRNLSGTDNIQVIYDEQGGASVKILDSNLNEVSSGFNPTQGSWRLELDDNVVTKIFTDGTVAYTRTIPQAFIDRFVFKPQIYEYLSSFIVFGYVGDPIELKVFLLDLNLDLVREKAVPLVGDAMRNSVSSFQSVSATGVGANFAFISHSNITYGSSATLRLWDSNLNELDNLPLFSGAWQGGANMKLNACSKWTVTDGVGLGYCKSGGCYRSETREVDLEDNEIKLEAYYGLEHYTTLGVGSEKYDWRSATSDGGYISANRNQDLNGFGNPVPVDAQVTFTKTDANGNQQWERDYLITDWEKMIRIHESEGEIFIVKNVDDALLISELECYNLPSNLPDLEITDVNVPATTPPGSTFFFDYKLSNNGTIASGASKVGLYFSRDDRLGFDTQIGNTFPDFASVVPGSSLNGGTSATLPNWSPGDYYLLLVADADGEVVESNENNNLTAIPFTISDMPTGGVDLEISSNLPNSTPAQWSVFTPTVTITNNGGETATGVEIYIGPSAGAIFQGGNEGTVSQGTFRAWANTWDVGTLAAGQSATLDVNLFRLIAGQFVMYTQVTALNETDIDSAPDNGTCCAGGEDDETPIYVGAAANGITNRAAITENLGNQPFAIVKAMPNPFTDEFKLQIFANENQESEITVTNAMGQAIFKKEVNLTEGMNTIPMNLDSDASGILMVKMTPFHPYLRQIRVMRVRD